MSTTTPSPVVVGVDGSHNSFRAACWAAAIADRAGAPLLLVHSASTAGHFISDAAVIAIRAAAADEQSKVAHDILATAESAVRQSFPQLVVESVVAADSAPNALTRLSLEAQLVVLGVEDVNPAAALLIGSTSLSVATHAVCPVVAWRAVPAPTSAPVVVGVDGTPAGTAALAAAFDFAQRFGAPVKAVRAWSSRVLNDPLMPLVVDGEAIEAAEARLLESAVQAWSQRYPDVDVQTVVGDAKPARALLDRSVGAQLVVVGNHRANTFASALLGSTGLNLLHHSAIPVMVCHAQDRAAASPAPPAKENQSV